MQSESPLIPAEEDTSSPDEVTGLDAPHRLLQNTEVAWRGAVAATLIVVIGVTAAPDIAPSRYFPNLNHYLPTYVLLAFAMGFGLSAVRSPVRADFLMGVPVLLLGGLLVAHILWVSIEILWL